MSTTISPNLPVSFSTYRTIRIQPTVALARRLAIAPVVRADWKVVAPDATEETLELVTELMKLRQRYINAAMTGLYDFGFAGFELFLDDDAKLVTKPLLADSVQIVVDNNGEFAGLQVSTNFQNTSVTGGSIFLNKDRSAFLGLDVEAGFFYGDSLLEVARDSYNDWIVTNEGAARYDAKIAGSIFQLRYPIGKSVDDEGNTRDNSEIAEELLEVVESSGSIATGMNRDEFPNSVNSNLPGPDWEFKFIGDNSPRQGSFIERMRYLDNLLVRSFGLPERAVLEGRFGTKAESKSMKDFALEAIESVHEFVTEEFQDQIMKPHIELMLGKDAAESVNLEAGPISTDELAYKQSIAFELIKTNPNFVDLDALLDEVNLPINPEQNQEPEEEEVEVEPPMQPIFQETPIEGEENA